MSDEDSQPDTYGTVHRAFLQALLSRQVTTYEEAKPLIAHIQTVAKPERPTLPEDVTQEDFEAIIAMVGNAISPLDFEIRSSVHQTSKERIYALVNTTSDSLTQMATMLTPDEVAFVKRVLDAIFDTNNTARAEIMAVKSMEIAKLAKAPNQRAQQTQPAQMGLSMTAAESVIEDMVTLGWFDKSPRGFYTLSQRGIMELTHWLYRTYNDEEEQDESYIKIKPCAACRDIVTIGQRCPNLECNVRMHNHCVRTKFRAQGHEKCESCQTDWQDAPPVGEKAAAYIAGRRSSTMTNGVESDTSEDDD